MLLPSIQEGRTERFPALKLTKELSFLTCFIFIIFVLIASKTNAGQPSDSTKICNALRVQNAPRIDGKLNEKEWAYASPATGFVQFRPEEGKPGTENTEVRIIYTDFAIYIGAWCFDKQPDQIKRQLGKRDQYDLNADYFYIKIDPYCKQQDAYEFGVYASGVQRDSRFSDMTYDAVWNSAVKSDEHGWYAEMEIPYSAFRFPSSEIQTWVLQFNRYIRRNRELQSWSYVPSEAANRLLYWGKLQGIENVKTPLRLAMVPYVGFSSTKEPVLDENGSGVYSKSLSYNYGADIKYGIDDRFTLDITLLPDFGQVQSDRLVKNLSYREVIYDENRPFFREGVELFSKGDLFYSRRIGRMPGGYYSVFDSVQSNESILENPVQTKLLNAIKLSGRTDKGLGIGIFNAVTAEMQAIIRNADGTKRYITTEPLTNYSVFVLDQQWKNNNSFYLTNTLAMRNGAYADARVTGSGFRISNKKNTLSLLSDGVMTIRYPNSSNSEPYGYRYSVGLEKQGGSVLYSIFRNVTNPYYNATDMGYYRVPGQNSTEALISINRYRPWKFIREGNCRINAFVADDFKTGKVGDNNLSVSNFINLMSWNAIFLGGGIRPFRAYDFFESRTEGQVFHTFRTWYGYAGFSTDYRKKFALDYSYSFGNYAEKFSEKNYSHEISCRIRPSDHLFIILSEVYAYDAFNLGYAGNTENYEPLIGGRQLDTWESKLQLSLSFTHNMSLSVIARQYWFTGRYRRYYQLDPEGELITDLTYSGNSNFNFNLFNADVIYEWRFAPGSVINLVYKNSVNDETDVLNDNFGGNFNRVMNLPHASTITAKVLYYLDYIRIHGKIAKRYHHPIG